MNAKKRNKKGPGSVKQKRALNALGVDTSSGEIGICVVSSGKCVLEEYMHAEGAYNRDILRFVDAALAKAGMKLDDFDIFASTLGPGSFTGVRVGVAVMKAFAQAKGRPFFGASTLDILAVSAAAGMKKGSIYPVLDARRNEVFSARYEVENGNAERKTGYFIMKYEDLLLMLTKSKNSAVVTLASDRKLNEILAEAGVAKTEAGHIDMKAFGRIITGSRVDMGQETVYTVMPDYIRKPDAEINREKKEKA